MSRRCCKKLVAYISSETPLFTYIHVSLLFVSWIWIDRGQSETRDKLGTCARPDRFNCAGPLVRSENPTAAEHRAQQSSCLSPAIDVGGPPKLASDLIAIGPLIAFADSLNLSNLFFTKQKTQLIRIRLR